MSNRRLFLYYSRLSVSEDLDTETNFLQMELGRFEKDIFKKCRHCCHVFDIKKNFEQDEDTSNACVKLLEKEVRINPFVYVLWKDNAKYRAFTDLQRSYVDYIFQREPIIGMSEEISFERLNIHLNSL